MNKTAHTASWRMALRKTVNLTFALAIIAYAAIVPALLCAPEEAVSAAAYGVSFETMDRQESREMAVDALCAVISDESLPQMQREEAQKSLQELLSCVQMEIDIESELLARGFGRAIANVSSNFASVMLENMPDEDAVSAVFEAVSRISGLESGKIRLIPALSK